MNVNVLSTTAFDEIITGAGVILTAFDPAAPTIADTAILFATSGGINATAEPSFIDYGEDVDNAPKNVKELKKFDKWECKISGTATTIDTEGMKMVGGVADVTNGVVALRNKLKQTDFVNLWWVGEKTEENVVSYIKLSNALSTTGINIQTTDKEKGKFEFEFTGHYSIDNQDTVPFEYGEITITE